MGFDSGVASQRVGAIEEGSKDSLEGSLASLLALTADVSMAPLLALADVSLANGSLF